MDELRRGVAAAAGRLVSLVLAASALAGTGCGPRDEPPPPAPAEVADPLAARGYRVTGGAAAGYVEDELCGRCHVDLYRSYQEVGMARSFSRPRPENLIEDFPADAFLHAPSRRYYQMLRRDGGLVMRRYQVDSAGAPINEVEQEVEWILGSGNHSRTYLYRSPWGELYQLPIAWYPQSRSWEMAPGFERPDHLGLGRLVRRECMFCHNAYPDVAAGSDGHHEPHRFPVELPEGIGCQRCHGPGAEHSRVAMREPVDFGRLYETIVNPADLPPRLRDDVCYGCHMQPSVAIPGNRRFGRGDYSFRPGQPLSDYLVAMDVDEPGRGHGERFEINHHPYRLEQSRCFDESGGELSCLTCHDPHRKVPPAERAAHFRAACLGCHAIDACRLDEMGSGHGAAGPAADDCAACHMAKRRTQDVVNVVMTDHRIRRRPGGPELVAPIVKTEPVIEDVRLLHPERAPAGALGELYRAYAVAEFSGGGHGEAIARLERLLPEVRPPQPEPYLALARGQLGERRLDEAEATLETILATAPDYPMARELLGFTHAGLGRRQAALAQIRAAIEGGRERPEARYNLGVLLTRYGSFDEALPELQRAVEMRPNMAGAWLYLGEVLAALDRPTAAAESYRRAVALEPTLGRAYLALGRLLLQLERREEALRYWRHGVDHAARPEPIVEALAAAQTQRPPAGAAGAASAIRGPGSPSRAASRR